MKKSKLIVFFSIILLTILIIIVYGVIKNINTEVIEKHMFYQYFAGRKVTYEGTITLENRKNITQITSEEQKIQLDSTPLYYVDEEKVIFPQNMAIVYPMRNGLMYKMNRFSKIKQIQESIYLEENEENKILENIFLYDGNDLYFFLEDSNIRVGEETYELSPLSYVTVQYNGNVEIYNKAKDEYTILEGTYKDVMAETEFYKINLSIDAIQYGEKQQLLIKNVDKLQNI